MRRTLHPCICLLLLLTVGCQEQEPIPPADDIFESVIDAMNAQSSFSATMRFQGPGEAEAQLLDVNYANMNQSPHRWQAYVSMKDLSSGRHLLIDSTYISSCLKRIEPTESAWQYFEHDGWSIRDNPETRTPPIPISELLSVNQVSWHVVAENEAEIALGHEPDPGGITMVLHVDRATSLVNRHETRADGIEIDVEYSRYGMSDVGRRAQRAL